MENVVFGGSYKIKPLRVMGGQELEECFFCFEVLKKGLFWWKRVEKPLTLSCNFEANAFFLGTYDVGHIKRTGFLPSDSIVIENYPLIISVLMEFSYFATEISTSEALKLRQFAKDLYNKNRPPTITGRYMP